MPDSNGLLRAARERTPSRRAPGEHMSRAELAETVCAWLWETTDVRYDLDGHYIAKLERGAVRWPGASYRAGLRHVLNVATDSELGFTPPPGVAATMPDLTPPSTLDLGDDLIQAGDESIAMLTLAEESNVGELTVEQLHADIERIARAYLKTPTKPLFIRSRGIRDRAFRLLQGRQHPRQTRDLYAAAGWAIVTLAWMSVDLGRPDVAEAHARTAWACAEAADHDELRGWIRATQHTAAYWQDDFRRAEAYAQDGLRFASGTSALFLTSAAAVDLARLGRLDQAQELLTAAQRLTVTPTPSEPGGPFLCTPERAAGLWAEAHLTLGQPDRTADHTSQALTRFEATPHTLRNLGSERMVRLHQVRAHLELNHLDAATTALEPVLTTAPEYRVRPLIHRISEVAAQLTARYPTEPRTQQLREQIRDFTQNRSLPAKPRPGQPTEEDQSNTARRLVTADHRGQQS